MEWQYVFVVRFNEGVLPLFRAPDAFLLHIDDDSLAAAQPEVCVSICDSIQFVAFSHVSCI